MNTKKAMKKRSQSSKRAASVRAKGASSSKAAEARPSSEGFSVERFFEVFREELDRAVREHPTFAKEVAHFDLGDRELVVSLAQLKAANNLLEKAGEANGMALIQEELYEGALEWKRGRENEFVHEMAQAAVTVYRNIVLGLETIQKGRFSNI